jgi:serine/threonine-protein kinase
MSKIQDPEKRRQADASSRASTSLPSTRRNLQTLFAAATLIVLLLAIAVGIWSLSRRLVPNFVNTSASSTASVPSLLPGKSIAVLPFENRSAEKEKAFLAEAVQDDLLTALGKVTRLKVISRISANTYPAGAPRDLETIGRALGVAHLLEGNVSTSGQKLQVAVDLIDTRSNRSEWKKTYESDFSDLFAIEGQIVQAVATQLQTGLSETEKAAVEEQPTKDLVAYGLYVRAKALIATISFNAQINEQLREAVQLLDQAIARDPDFFLAHCQLSAAHNYLYFFGLDHTPNRLVLAENALKAIEHLRPAAGETHFARANFFYRCHLDYDRARSELALAQRTLPNDSEIFELTGYIDRRQGLWNESARSLQKALDLDPRNFFMLQQIATSYQEFRQFGAMAAALDRALVLVPKDLDTRITRALVDLEWRADTKPLHRTIDAILSETPDAAEDLSDQWLYLALCERDPAAAARALAAIPAHGISSDLNFPRTWCEGLAARARGDTVAARKAFAAARAEIEEKVHAQPDYGAAFCVLGLLDAALGDKENAIREGRHAVELLPITKDSIDGAELMKYLAVIYAWCGEKDLALAQIEATLRIPSGLSYGNLKLHPNWDALRGDPRFEKIVAAHAPRNATE